MEKITLAGAAASQFPFFERAVSLLENATDADLAVLVHTYSTFMSSPGARTQTPTFGVELVWRTHLLSPRCYAEACARLEATARSASPAVVTNWGTAMVDHTPLPANSYSVAVARPRAQANTHSGGGGGWISMDLVSALRRQQKFLTAMVAGKDVYSCKNTRFHTYSLLV